MSVLTLDQARREGIPVMTGSEYADRIESRLHLLTSKTERTRLRHLADEMRRAAPDRLVVVWYVDVPGGGDFYYWWELVADDEPAKLIESIETVEFDVRGRVVIHPTADEANETTRESTGQGETK